MEIHGLRPELQPEAVNKKAAKSETTPTDRLLNVKG